MCEPLEPGKLKLKVFVKVFVTRCTSHCKVKVQFFVWTWGSRKKRVLCKFAGVRAVGTFKKSKLEIDSGIFSLNFGKNTLRHSCFKLLENWLYLLTFNILHFNV